MSTHISNSFVATVLSKLSCRKHKTSSARRVVVVVVAVVVVVVVVVVVLLLLLTAVVSKSDDVRPWVVSRSFQWNTNVDDHVSYIPLQHNVTALHKPAPVSN